MDGPTTAALFIALYAFWLAVLAIRVSRSEEPQQFINAGRRLGAWDIAASLSAGFRDGAGLAMWFALALGFGFGSLWLVAGATIGLAIQIGLAGKARDLVLAHDFNNLDELLHHRLGKGVARQSAAVILCTSVLYSAAQIYVSGSIATALFGVSPLVGIWLTALTVGLYVGAGGFELVLRTDRIQWVLMSVFILGAIIFARGRVSFSEAVASAGSIDWKNGVGLFLLGLLAMASSADVWQRVYYARSTPSARRGLLGAIAGYSLMCLALILFCLLALQWADVSAKEPFFTLFDSMPAILVGGLAVFAIASVMSTLDSHVFLFSSVAVSFKSSTEEQAVEGVRRNRWVVAGMMLIIAVISSFVGDVVSFVFSAVTLITILFPIILYSLLTNGAVRDGERSLLNLGLALAFFLYVLMFVRGDLDTLILTPIPAGVCGVFALLAWIGRFKR